MQQLTCYLYIALFVRRDQTLIHDMPVIFVDDDEESKSMDVDLEKSSPKTATNGESSSAEVKPNKYTVQQFILLEVRVV